MEHVTLNNGVAMPILGFGVFQIPDAAQCEQVVTDALAVSYQSIDTASAYLNEDAVNNDCCHGHRDKPLLRPP
jgi:2,5-diketo-D-gluconate reductase A